MRKVAFLVHITRDQKNKLKQIADRLGTNMASLIREAIELLFDQYLGPKDD